MLSCSTSVSEYVWLKTSCHQRSLNILSDRKALSICENNSAQTCTRTINSDGFFPNIYRSPQLAPVFPIESYTPSSRCRHCGPIEMGSSFCCMICHTSGHDDHPVFQEKLVAKRSVNVKSNANFRVAYSSHRISTETRRQRRQRIFRFEYRRICGDNFVKG